MTSYTVLMSEELFEQIEQDPSRLPVGFRVVEATAQTGGRVGEPPSWRSFYVQVEDDGAPTELEGALVDVTVGAEYDEQGGWLRSTVKSRHVVADDGEYRALVMDGGRRSVQPSGRGKARHLPPYTEGLR